MAVDPAQLQAMLSYQPSAGRRAHRAAGAAWLKLCGLTADPETIVVSAGAQHGVLATLSALTRPGDRISTEALSYPGIKLIAHMLGLRLEPVAMDADGVLPESFESLCRAGEIKALCCTPTLQNQTTATM